jgi:quercetin dioxygenase-like cupin family protein
MGFLSLNDINQRELLPGFRVRFVHTGNMTLAYWEIEAGSELPEHSHPHEQVVNVIDGTLELLLGDEKREMSNGQIAVIPPNVVHAGKAITTCRVIDVFHPVREDYR